MTGKTYRTMTGKVLTENDLESMAEGVEHADYAVGEPKTRRVGRPAMGSGPADVVPVRIDPELRSAIDARAAADETTTSAIILAALRQFLDVA